MTDFRFPWDDTAGAPPIAKPRPEPPAIRPRRGRRPSLGRAKEILARQAALPAAVRQPAAGEGGEPLHHTEWQACVLSVSGPQLALQDFDAAAAGAGVTPWQRDFATEEEDLFHRLAARYPQTGRLSLEACRIFAAQFRERLQDHHDRVLVSVGQSRACPFDLHALLPVPPQILDLGAMHPEALRWLASHWGTTEIRKAAVLASGARGYRRSAGLAERRFGFFAADTLPQAGLRCLAKAWPALRLELQLELQRAGGAG